MAVLGHVAALNSCSSYNKLGASLCCGMQASLLVSLVADHGL